MKRAAFALWEFLIVLVIICIGAAVLFPPRHHNRESARRSSCTSNLKQIALAFAQYTRDADAKAPPVANTNGGWSRLILPYVKSEEIYQCRSTRDNKSGATDYFFNARLAGAQGKLKPFASANPSFTILCGEGADDAAADSNLSQWPAAWRRDEKSPAWRHLDGANILFADGHVRWFKPEKIFGAQTSGAQAATPTFAVK